MGFQGDLLPDELFPAKKHRAAPVVGEEAVIISAALAQALTQVVAGGAGENGKVNVVHADQRRICGGLHQSVGAGAELGEVSHQPD